MNHFCRTGNFTSDPELRRIPGSDTPVVSFRLAVNGREYQKDGERVQEVAFLDFEAWGTGAEAIANNFRKGDSIIIDRSAAKVDSWEDKATKQKRSRVKFRVERFEYPRGNPRRQEPAGAGVGRGRDEDDRQTPF